LDLRRALRTGVSRSPRDCGCFRTWFEGVAAALSVLRVILITSVASIAFSFADNSSASWLSVFWVAANVFLVAGLVVLPGFT
jgi:predicted membrane metal-binding protein